MKETYEVLLEMVLIMDNDKAYTVNPMHRYKADVKAEVESGEIEISDYGFEEDEDDFYNINEDGELRSYHEGALEELVIDYQNEILNDYLEFTVR